MKVVFDTNVYVSEAIGGAAAARIIEATAAARWRIHISDHILDELYRVISEDLGLSRRSALLAVVRAARRAKMVALRTSRHTISADPHDSPILLTALQSGSAYLISNDRHLLALNPYPGLQIVSMADYHRMLEDEGLIKA